MTHSRVSGDMYGLAWYTLPSGSANAGAKNGLSASLWESSSARARTPRTTRACSTPERSMKHASPIACG